MPDTVCCAVLRDATVHCESLDVSQSVFVSTPVVLHEADAASPLSHLKLQLLPRCRVGAHEGVGPPVSEPCNGAATVQSRDRPVAARASNRGSPHCCSLQRSNPESDKDNWRGVAVVEVQLVFVRTPVALHDADAVHLVSSPFMIGIPPGSLHLKLQLLPRCRVGAQEGLGPPVICPYTGATTVQSA